MPVLLERPGRKPGQLIGRSPYMQAVHVAASAGLMGRIVPVRIVAAGPNSLSGRLVEAADRGPGQTARGSADAAPATMEARS